MGNNQSMKMEIFKSFLALIVGIILAMFPSYYLGKQEGKIGKNPEFEKIEPGMDLKNSTWQVAYDVGLVEDGSEATEMKTLIRGKKENLTPNEATAIQLATVRFEQFGSRIVGQGYDLEGRTWMIEGAAAQHHLCYIYYDYAGRQFSFGTVLLEMENSGAKMRGQWVGWTPDSNQLQLRKVTLTKL